MKKLFVDILYLLEGIELETSSKNTFLLIQLCQLLGFSSLQRYLLQPFVCSQKLDQLLQVFSISISNLNEDYFQNPISFLAQHFTEIPQEALFNLPLSTLQAILSSDSLLVENENILFQLLMTIISLDSNKAILLKFVKFEAVKPELLIQYFSNLTIDDIENDLWESIKKRLFFDILPDSKSNFKRWKHPNVIFTKQDSQLIIEKINSFSKENIPFSQKLVKFLNNLI